MRKRSHAKPHIYAAFAHERHQTFLAQAEADGRNRRARLQRRQGSATAAAAGRPVVLRDGSAVLIRPVRRADAPLLADGFARLSARFRRLRLGYFTDVDHHNHEEIAVTVLVRREPGVLQYEIMLGAEGTGE
jgi:hypothetical protein